jgi:hypothetical protein
MHPSRTKLKAYVNGELEAHVAGDIKRHLDECLLCKELCENYRQFIDSLAESVYIEIPLKAKELADRLYRDAKPGNIIPLFALTIDDTDSSANILLAADDAKEQLPVVNLATFYSEEPELVLRLMRDNNQQKDYLHLIGDDPNLVAGVLVQVPELDVEFLTDNMGRAYIDHINRTEINNLKWQIKLPTAIFDFKPLTYNSDQSTFQKEYILETADNKVKIEISDRGDSNQIVIKVLEIKGIGNYGPLRAIISHGNHSKSFNILPEHILTFDIQDANDSIKIRLFE